MLPALRAAYAAHITDLDASSAEDAKPAPISHTLLGVAGTELFAGRLHYRCALAGYEPPRELRGPRAVVVMLLPCHQIEMSIFFSTDFH